MGQLEFVLYYDNMGQLCKYVMLWCNQESYVSQVLTIRLEFCKYTVMQKCVRSYEASLHMYLRNIFIFFFDDLT